MKRTAAIKNEIKSKASENETPATKAKNAPVRPKLWYQKIGGGSLRMLGRIIKPNEKFLAYPEEIPAAFKDLIVCQDSVEVEKASTLGSIPIPAEVIFELETVSEEDDQYNVINKKSKKSVNSTPLSLVEAEELLDTLIG